MLAPVVFNTSTHSHSPSSPPGFTINSVITTCPNAPTTINHDAPIVAPSHMTQRMRRLTIATLAELVFDVDRAIDQRVKAGIIPIGGGNFQHSEKKKARRLLKDVGLELS